MVCVFTSFVVLLSTTSALATTFKRDVAIVKADIAALSYQVTTLDNSINAFPDTGGSLADAMRIHNSAVALDKSVKTSTINAQAAELFSEEDGQSILQLVQAIEPTILSVLNAVVAKKAAFQALPIGGPSAVIHEDLVTLDKGVKALATALIAKTSDPDLVTSANKIKSTVGKGFATAIAAYTSK